MTTTYANQTTSYFDNLIAAQIAGGAQVNLAGGTLVVGDGNGAVPAISDLIAANGVTHEVWRGQVIQAVVVDPNALNQIDVSVDIPATSGSVEIGPFTVREFAILDATGACCIVGTTNLEKTISSQGQVSDLAWTIGVAVASTNAVIVTPPNAGFATLAQVIAGVNANLPGAQAPVTKTDTLQPSGWLYRVFGVAPATQSVDVVSPASSGAAMGSGRPASAAEWAAGAATAGTFAWPWPTLQQVTGAFAAIANSIAALGAAVGAYLPLAGGTMQGMLSLFADPTVAAHAATKRYVDAAVAALTTALAAYLLKAGGTMTGFLTLSADPTQGLHAATKEYVDAAALGALKYASDHPTIAPPIGALAFFKLPFGTGAGGPNNNPPVPGSTITLAAAGAAAQSGAGAGFVGIPGLPSADGTPCTGWAAAAAATWTSPNGTSGASTSNGGQSNTGAAVIGNSAVPASTWIVEQWDFGASNWNGDGYDGTAYVYARRLT